MRIDKLFGMLLALMIAWNAEANNVRIKNQAIPVEMNLGKDSLMVKFDIRWDNSWRIGENWDAVYVFLKYKRKNVNEKWYHLRIKESGHSLVSSNGPALNYKVMKDTMGCVGMFIYRRGEGTGSVGAEVRLKLDISQGDLQHYDASEYQDFIRGKFEISAMAIEMVYVPYGPYFVGDGRSERTFCDEAKDAYYVESEEAQTLGEDRAGTVNKIPLPGVYPKGFSGFYCMKYEISQEQYVDFLNKLSFTDQKKRIGNDLEKLSEGQFVFGSPNFPDHRNGIILATRKNIGEPWVFANNLNIRDEFNMPDDGQALACNYMTPEDLWAYADWVGLRPMSEMEFEKACRQRNPVSRPTDFQYAWDSQQITPVTSISDAMTVKEKPDDAANVNSGGGLNGPLRCGSFARPGNKSMEAAGASHWGIMDLSGNLAEICCNTERGKAMQGNIYGDGNLLSTPLVWLPRKFYFIDSLARCGAHSWPQVAQGGCGYSGSHWPLVHRIYWETPYYDFYGNQIIVDVIHRDTMHYNKLIYADPYADYAYHYSDTTIMVPVFAWVDTLDAYGTRGGSYATNTRDYNLLTVSGRGRAVYFSEGMQRDPECTFRLVRDVETARIGVGNIVLPNGLYRDSVVICADGNYTIKEEFAGTTPGAVIFSWEYDRGSGWELLPDKTGAELVLNEVWNKDTAMVEIKFRRKTMAPEGEGYSNEVTVVVGGAPLLYPDKAEVDYCDNSGPLICQYNVMADSVRWVWKDHVIQTDYMTKTSTYYPKYAHFGNPGNYNDVYCEVYVGGCMQKLAAFVNVVVQAVTCPERVTDPITGESYAVLKTQGCHCWMAEDLKTVGVGSIAAGSQMYNWEDLSIEPTSDHSDANVSDLCPPGFYVPTEGELWNLVNELRGDPVTTQKFLAGGVGGFYDAVGGGTVDDLNYYWAGLYTGIEVWKDYVSFPVLFYDTSTQEFDVVYEVYYEDYEGFYPTSGGEGDDAGSFYFPIRCIMKK